MIVIDPAHGGTDNGAQGPNGTVEKDVVLRLARQIRSDFAGIKFLSAHLRQEALQQLATYASGVSE